MESSRAPRAVKVSPLVIIAFLLLSNSSLAELFSVVVLPDTQFYSQDNPAIFTSQTEWIRNNQQSRSIIYAAHLGDLVDSRGCNHPTSEWNNAANSIRVLDGVAATDAIIPYGVLHGNHDFDPLDSGGLICSPNRDEYNRNFGPQRYPAPGSASFYGGSADDTTNDNNFTLFESAGGIKFIAVNLGFSSSNGPDEAAALVWAGDRLKQYEDRVGILTSHFILTDSRTGGGENGVDCDSSDTFSAYGRAMWDELKDNPNLALVLSGHCRGERSITFNAGDAERPGCLGTVHVMMSNYQAYENEASGYLRIMSFDTDLRSLAVETISPWPANGRRATPITDLSTMDTNSVSNFSLDYNLFDSTCSSRLLPPSALGIE